MRLSYTVYLCCLLLSACGSIKEIKVTEYKEVYIPVKCQKDIPEKPTYNRNEPNSAKTMIEYYRLVEVIAKSCVAEKGTNGQTNGRTK